MTYSCINIVYGIMAYINLPALIKNVGINFSDCFVKNGQYKICQLQNEAPANIHLVNLLLPYYG